jgi:hypothetical protein
MTDTSKNWTTDQWKYYSIKNKNPNSSSYNFGAGIVSNTANTITYINYWTPGTPTLGKLEFANGDQYEIHKILRIMDGCGVGKSDHLKTGQGNPPINLDHGNVPYYAQSASEPIYCWNNTLQSDGRELKWNSAKPGMLIREGIEYFNLGKGLANPPSAVTTRYDAALNGVQYNGDFTYPHPLVSGAPTPTPRATPRSQQHLQKKKKNSKKLKRRNWPKKIGD